MKYRVRWLPTAEDELTYEIREDTQEVFVVHIWQYRAG